MAIGGPNGGGAGEGEGEGGGIFADINITPLTDIFLVLLIIFMVTTTAIAETGQTGGFKVSLPKGGTGEALAVPQDFPVAVLADGRVVVRGKVVDAAGLETALAETAAKSPDTLVLVQADEGVPHGRVVAVMEAARRKGLTRLAIATKQEAGSQGQR